MRRPRGAAVAVVVGLVVALTASACASSTAPGSAVGSSPPASQYLVVPTPWPSGTTGRFGLRVDPALLSRLPRSAGGLPLRESALDELASIDDEDLSSTAEAFAVARAGQTGDADWLVVSLIRVRPDFGGRDSYLQLVDDYRGAGCEPAGGVSGSREDEISDLIVNVATCAEGVTLYASELDDRVFLFATEMGTRRLGRQLLETMP